MNQNTSERLKAIAEKVKRQKELEAIKDAEAYKKMTTGVSWKIFTGLTFFCILLAILTTVDVYVDGETEPITKNDYKFERSLYAIGFQSVWVDDNLYMPSINDLAGFDENSFEVTYSLIFNDPKSLSFIQSPYYSGRGPKPDLVKQTTIKQISIYSHFPYIQLVLIIPIFVFLFKRPEPWFKFMRFTCLLLIFPFSIFLCLNLIL